MPLSVFPERVIPFRREKDGGTATIFLTNMGDTRIVFRVRINVQNAYVVKPSISLLHPGEKMTLEIHLTPEAMEMPRRKDRFLICFLALESTYEVKDRSILEVWKELTAAGKSFEERKLGVVITETPEEYNELVSSAAVDTGPTRETGGSLKMPSTIGDGDESEGVPLVLALMLGVFCFLLGGFLR